MNRRILIIPVALMVVCVEAFAGGREGNGGTVTVRGYVRKDGTYVPPHHRTAPDGNFQNNWSTVGNYNPYTGEPGTVVTPPARSPSAGTSGYSVPVYAPLPVTDAYSSTPSVPIHYPAVPTVPATPSASSIILPDASRSVSSDLLGAPALPSSAPSMGAISVPASAPAPARPLTYLEVQKARDVERAQFWQARGYSFNPTYMTAYSMDQKVKDIERARYWQSQGYSFSPDYMTAYSMDQKVKDIERARYWQSRGYSFNPEHMTAYSMDQKVKDIERAKFWQKRGLNFDSNYMTTYSMDREAERLGIQPQ